MLNRESRTVLLPCHERRRRILRAGVELRAPSLYTAATAGWRRRSSAACRIAFACPIPGELLSARPARPRPRPRADVGRLPRRELVDRLKPRSKPLRRTPRRLPTFPTDLLHGLSADHNLSHDKVVPARHSFGVLLPRSHAYQEVSLIGVARAAVATVRPAASRSVRIRVGRMSAHAKLRSSGGPDVRIARSASLDGSRPGCDCRSGRVAGGLPLRVAGSCLDGTRWFGYPCGRLGRGVVC